jgi:hypothetical protein
MRDGKTTTNAMIYANRKQLKIHKWEDPSLRKLHALQCNLRYFFAKKNY